MMGARLRWLLPGALLVLALQACGNSDDPWRPRDGSGGTGGAGGTGGTGGTGGGEPNPGDPWKDLAPVTRNEWAVVGYAARWQKARLGAEGRPGYVVADQGLAAVDAEGHPLWHLESKGGGPFGGQILDLKVVNLGDAADHLLALTSDGAALLVRGEDGHIVWARPLEYVDDRRDEIVVLGDAADPLFFSIFGKAVHHVRTGEVAFRHELREPPIYATSLPREGDSPLIVIAVDPGSERPPEKPDVHAFTVEGQRVFSASTERYVTQLGWAPLGEDGAPVLLAGTNDARLVAFGADGARLWTRELGDAGDGWATYVDLLLVDDVDGDGLPEIFAELETLGSDRVSLVATAADGTLLFRRSLDRALSYMDWIPTPGGPRLVLAYEGYPLSTDVATLDARTGENLQTILGLRGPRGLFRAHDASKIFVGTVDGRAFFLDGTGSVKEGFYVGNPVLYAFPASTEGILVATPWGVLASVDEGASRWARHFDHRARTVLGEAHLVEEEGRGVLVVSGILQTTESGTQGFHFLSEDGELLGSISTSRMPTAFDLANLDGEGPGAIVTIHLPETGSACSLVAYGRDRGEVLWLTEIPECSYLWLDAADVDGDGREEVAVAGFRPGFASFAGLVDADGKVRWMERFSFQPRWTIALPEGVAVGGTGDDGHGFAAYYDADSGEKVWQARIPAWRDPERPLESRFGFTLFATAVDDQNGDGFAELALTSAAGQVHLLDGKSGEILWTTWIREDGSTSDSGGGPIAYVPPTESTPGYLVATEQESRPVLTTAAILDLQGNRRGEVPARGGVSSVSVRRVGDAEWRVALAGRFGARVIAVAPKDEAEKPGEAVEK